MISFRLSRPKVAKEHRLVCFSNNGHGRRRAGIGTRHGRTADGKRPPGCPPGCLCGGKQTQGQTLRWVEGALFSFFFFLNKSHPTTRAAVPLQTRPAVFSRRSILLDTSESESGQGKKG